MPDPDPDLLFALIALRSNLITTTELLAAVAEMDPARSPSLREHLLGRGSICPADVVLVEGELAAVGVPGEPANAGPWTTVGTDDQSDSPSTERDPFAARAPASSFLAEGGPGWAGEPPNFGEFAARARRFHRMRLLARGGLGAVFVAHDAELNRDVALKEILEAAAGDANSRARFLLEAEITGSLEHPGIVPVYGLGQSVDGRPYYAMRLIRGKTMAREIREHHDLEGPGRDPGERLLGIRKLLARFIEVCNALAYAHSKGVIHRDIKPGNVMLGQFGETLLVDWGLAKQVGREQAPGRAVGGADAGAAGDFPASGLLQTARGASFGTPHFMSPEQAAGDVDATGPASDIYGLGASLYVLLTGRLPFEGIGFESILAGTMEGDFPAPRQVNRRVHPGLDAVCLKAMALRPEDRYPSARAMADDLERWMADEPVEAWREPPSVRARRWVKSRQTLVTSATAALIVATLGAGYALYDGTLREAEHRARAAGWVRTMVRSGTTELPQILEQSLPERDWIAPLLARMGAETEKSDPRGRLHVDLALVRLDPSRLDDRLQSLYDAMLGSGPDQLPVIRGALAGRSALLVPRLWEVLEDPGADPGRRFNAGCALAGYDPPDLDSERGRWAPHGPFLVERAVDEISAHASLLPTIQGTLQPAARVLFGPLLAAYRDRDPALSTRRSIAAHLLDQYASVTGEQVELLLNADTLEYPKHLARLEGDPDGAVALLDREIRRGPDPSWDAAPDDPSAAPAALQVAMLRQALAERQGRAGVALVILGAADRAWPMLRLAPDPSVRTELVRGFARYGADPSSLVDRLGSEPDLSARRALILALGEFPAGRLAEAERRRLVEDLLDRFRTNPDPGLHAAIDWLLRVHWGEAERVGAIDRELAGQGVPADRDWYVDGEGQTLAILRGPIEAAVGSPPVEFARGPLEGRHTARIARTFAIGTREVTAREYARFLADNTDLAPYNPVGHLPPDGPVLSVNFFDAARYCNWLSAREGIPPTEWCYPEKVAREMSLSPGHLGRSGYRLPTEAEWEVACRAGTATPRFFGVSEPMSDRYAWTRQNSRSLPHPVAQLKPNDLGLFDALGNAWEWTVSAGAASRVAAESPMPDGEADPELSDDTTRVLRGGSFDYGPEMSRSANRPGLTPSSRYYTLGFRVARTLPAPR